MDVLYLDRLLVSTGYFISILVMCNFLLAITWFPACIVMHHNCACAQRCSRGHAQQHDEQPPRETRCLESVLSGPVYRAVTHRRGGPALLVVLAGVALALGLTAASIKRSSATMLLLHSSHIASQYQLKAPQFASSPGIGQEAVSVTLVFGVTPIDTGDHNDPDSEGELVLDSSFDITDPAAQQYLVDLGPATRALTVVDEPAETALEGFDTWLRTAGTGDCSVGLPLPRAAFTPCLRQWYASAGQNSRSELMFAEGTSDVVAYRPRFQTNVEVQNEWDYGKLKPLSETFESFLKEQPAPESANGGFFTTGKFVVTDLQDNMVSSAITSAGLSTTLAFTVILASTRNLAVAVFAIVTVICIVSSVMGSIVLMGWELGLLESMCMSILVGMSVDFVVHFAHAWVSDGGGGVGATRREELVARTHASLSTVGVSVLSAGLTTTIAAFVLFFGEIVFFSKFGTMLALAMLFSLAYSVLFFHALATVAAPGAGCGRRSRLHGDVIIAGAAGKAP